MKICLLNDSDVFAGTESHVFTLASGLQQAGVPAVIACPPASPLSERAAESHIETVDVPKRGLVDRPAIRSLVSLLRSKQIDIIHTHNGRTHLNAVLALTLAGRGKCVATQHFIEPDHATQHGPKALLYRQAHRWVNRRTARFIAISEAVKREMLARQEAPEQMICVVPNGIHAPTLEKLASGRDVRADLQITSRAALIVCTARLEREKDVSSLISAMSDVVKRLPDALCVIAGEGSQHQTLAAQISAAGLEGSVRLLGFRTDALALIRAADVFVLPSLAEPFGLVLLEAMALSRPVVATCSGGPLEIVEDEATGLLVPPAHPAALGQAILRLLGDPGLAAKMGEAGGARFNAQYTALRMVRATQEVYQSVGCPN